MNPHIGFITLGVSDLNRAKRLQRGSGLAHSGGPGPVRFLPSGPGLVWKVVTGTGEQPFAE